MKTIRAVLLCAAGVATAGLVTAGPATGQTPDPSTGVPPVAGFVAGATGYAHPTSWPWPTTIVTASPFQEALEGFVGSYVNPS
jgi:hypothetical protein